MTAYTSAVQHVATQLAGLGLPVCEGIAPEGVTYPIVLVQQYGDAVDTNGTGYFRALTQVDLTVRVVGHGGDIAVETAADAMDQALHGTSGGPVAGCMRLTETSMIELEDGQEWTYLGGVYRVTVAG